MPPVLAVGTGCFQRLKEYYFCYGLGKPTADIRRTKLVWKQTPYKTRIKMRDF